MAIPLSELAPGKVVRLASGSPKMVVTEVVDGRVAVLWWWDSMGILTDQFVPEVLVWPRPAPTEGNAE
jgi:uncharacterized protein YodC (DUF2158 family)